MAINGHQDIGPVPGNGTSVVPGPLKRARARKSAGSRPTAKAPTSLPKEILFKELPDPQKRPEPPYLWIDFPQQGEILLGPAYVIRMGIGGAATVEISIDKGSWRPCRSTSGYWWYDWSSISRGKHTLVVRMQTPDGRWFRTPVRTCEYR